MKKILILSLTLLASNFAKASLPNGNSNASAPRLDLSDDSTTPPATATPPASAASTPSGPASAGFGKQNRHLRTNSKSMWNNKGKSMMGAALEKLATDQKLKENNAKTAAKSKAKTPVASPLAKK